MPLILGLSVRQEGVLFHIRNQSGYGTAFAVVPCSSEDAMSLNEEFDRLGRRLSDFASRFEEKAGAAAQDSVSPTKRRGLRLVLQIGRASCRERV